MKDYAQVEVTSRAQWRAWLAANHRQRDPIWLVTYKKAAGDRYVPYAEIVEEALCFGWVDSVPRKLDQHRTMLMIAPRKAGSTWSALNRERVARLAAAGLMMPAGQAKIDAAIANRSWLTLASAETGEAPGDLAAALAQAQALAGWTGFSLATRKRIIEYVEAAKQPQTRAARIAKVVEGAAKGTDPLLWRKAGTGGDPAAR